MNASKCENPEYSTLSFNSRDEDFSETSNSQLESRSLTPPTVSKKLLNPGEHSRTCPPLCGGKYPQTKKHSSRKTTRLGGQNAVWRALNLVSSTPFSREIEKAKLPERYTAPRFETYNGRTNPVAHIGHYQQTMALSRYNDPLMCRPFPSSLGKVAMRWFNQLGRRTINSWDQMAEAFVARFITNSRKTREMDALLTMKLQDNETIKDYSTRFWETYNDIDGYTEDVAIKTFKLGLPIDTSLRQSLTKRPAQTLVKLMHRIDQFIRVEEDGRGTPLVQAVTQPKVITPKPAARTGNAAKSLSPDHGTPIT